LKLIIYFFFSKDSKFEIQIGKQLGKGSFGTIYNGKWRGIEVAVKVKNKNKH